MNEETKVFPWFLCISQNENVKCGIFFSFSAKIYCEKIMLVIKYKE